MQPLTVADVASLTGPRLSPDYGIELLTPSLALVEDISADCSGGVVRRNNLADVHGACDLSISRTLAWGFDRVRPYTIVNGVRRNQGVFTVTSPKRALGETPETHAVAGFDGLYQLLDNIGNSWSVPVGANVLDSVRAVLTAAGVVAPVLLDSSGAAKTLATPMVWPLTSSESPTWIKVSNELLASVGYRGLWCDWDGNFRSGPYVLPSLRPSEFRLDVGSQTRGIVAEDREVENDVFGLSNWLRVVRNGLTVAPAELAGWHTMVNQSTGPSSINAVGIRRAPVVFLDAVSQADLEVQGERLFAAATRSSEVLTFKTSPLPYWHADRLEYVDAALGDLRQIQVRSWELPLAGGDMAVVAETVQ